MELPPPLDSVPYHTIDFAADFGLTDYTPEAIYARMQQFEKEDFETVLQYLSDKLGYDHNDQDKYAQGLGLAASWSLINK